MEELRSLRDTVANQLVAIATLEDHLKNAFRRIDALETELAEETVSREPFDGLSHEVQRNRADHDRLTRTLDE